MRNTVCTLALAAFVVAGLTCSAAAQNDTNSSMNGQSSNMTMTHHPHQMNANHDLMRMTKHLNLTQDQQTQIKPILQNRDQQLNQLWMDNSMSKQDRRSKSMEIREDCKNKIDPILNDQQKEKFDSMMGKRHHRMHHGQQPTTGTEGTSPQ